jgi:hypothetical protein
MIAGSLSQDIGNFCRVSPSQKPIVLAVIACLRQYIGGTIVYFFSSISKADQICRMNFQELKFSGFSGGSPCITYWRIYR